MSSNTARIMFGSGGPDIQAAYDRLACSYDSQPNPLLVLEERYLERLLPELENRDLLDIGCGTGRWLAQFIHQRPRSITGIDISTPMLEMAAAKIGSAATLV